MTTFVPMYHPGLPGTPHVEVPVQAEDLYAAKGWLLVDGSTPVSTSEFLTPFAADLRYLQRWQPSLAVTAGQMFLAPDGQPIQRIANGTTRSTYDATEQATWTAALKAAYVPKWKASTAYASGEPVLNPSGQIVTANSAFTSGSSYNAANWTIVSGSGGASLPTQTGNAGKFLTTDGTTASWGTPAGGGGTSLTVAAAATANATLAGGKHTPVDATSGARTMTLPTGQAAGTFISAEKFDSTTNAVTLSGSIRGVGSSTVQLVWAKEALLLVADSAGSWWPVAGHKTKASLDKAYLPINSGIVVMPPPSGDTTGATDTANFKAARDSLPTVTIYPTPSTKTGTSATFRQGTIVLQAAPANVWQDQVGANATGTPYYFGTAGSSAGDVGNIGPFVSVIGPGHNSCVIRYLGTGDCLRAYNTVFPSSDTFDTLAGFAGKIDGFTIDGTSAGAGAVGLHAGDFEGIVLGDDFWVCNFTGGSVGTPATASKGIFWDNAVSWTENVRARANLYNNTIGVYFSPTTGDLSFMYSSHEYKIYGWPNQYGVMLDNGANFDQGSLVVRANLKTSASANTGALIAFGTSTGPNNRIADSHLDIQAETNSGISGGTNYPRTLYFSTAFYSINRCYGILSFGNTWTASNYNVSFPLNYNGIINGDATLLSAQAVNVAGVAVSGTAGAGKVLTASSASAATWQTSAAGGAYYPWLAQGLLGWSFDETATGSSGIAPAAQQVTVAKVMVPSTITITNVVANVTGAGATLTSGAQNVGVVYDSSGNLLGQTADQSTAWTSTGPKIMPLTAPVTVTGGPGVFVYVGILAGGTTLPTFSRSSGTNNTGLTAPNLRFTRTSATAQTSPAASVSLGSTSTNSYFFGVS